MGGSGLRPASVFEWRREASANPGAHRVHLLSKKRTRQAVSQVSQALQVRACELRHNFQTRKIFEANRGLHRASRRNAVLRDTLKNRKFRTSSKMQ
eukprot:6175715-Pleurochrysis_carterae.AAC.1